MTLPENQFFQTISSFNANKTEVLENSKGNGIIFTYIGLYLGVVFLIASAVILALQQLSQANENKQRYTILHQLGTETHMIHHAILLQIAIYFLLPLLLAIAHSYVGIHVINVMVISFGKADIMASSIITAGVILCIYGLYFLITYTGYKKLVIQK